MTKRINDNLLKAMIVKEIKSLKRESVNHEGVRNVVDASSKLLSAVEDFEQNMTFDMENALSSCLEELKSNLLKMVENPVSYVEKEKKVISLKKQE